MKIVSWCLGVTALASVASVCLTTPVHAQTPSPSTAAETSFQKGVELYKAEDYKGALAEFLAAYNAKPHHSVLFNIAQCYQMIDAAAEALHYYELYLDLGGDFVSQERKEMVQEQIDELKTQLIQVTLIVEPAGADVMIDGKSVGTSPIPETQYVDPGEHVLMIDLEDHETFKKTVVAKRGEPVEIQVTLEPEQKTPPPPAPEPEPSPPPPPEPEPPADQPRSKGGIGIFLGTEASAIVEESHEYTSGTRVEQGSKMDAGVFLGVFGEKIIVPYFALGAEASLTITDVDEVRTKTWDPAAGAWSYPNPWLACERCKRPLAFSLALRIKCPIPLTKVVGIYPLATVGIGTVTMRYNEKVYANRDTLTFFGMSYSGGVGIEFYTPVPVTPFLELRYVGGFGTVTSRESIDQYWKHEGDELQKYMMVYHSFTLAIGTRFL